MLTRTAVYDAHDESWWGLAQDDRQRFKDWLTGQGYEYDGRAVYRTEIHTAEQPFARIFAFALDKDGRKFRDPATGDAAKVAPVDVPLTSPPPVQPAEAA